MISRCPFLNTVPSVYQKLSTKSVSHAHKCPVLMELASRALPCSAAVARGSPAKEGQLQISVFKYSVHVALKILFLTRVLLDPANRIAQPLNETAPPAGSTMASRCPFLTAATNSVVREAGMELQEDIQGMDSQCAGEQPCT